MLWLILRGLAAGFIVVAVAEIGRSFPRLSALILTLPLVIPLVFLAMYFREANIAPISRLSREVLVLIPLGLPFFVPMALAQRFEISFWAAFAVGLLIVTVNISLYLWLAPRSI
jgi:hypothetical protein